MTAADKPGPITREQAVTMAASNWWVDMTPRDIAMFQLHEDMLCMPWHVFMGALEAALGRNVYTHELALNRDGLKRELRGEDRAPTIDEIIKLIPADKRIVIWPDGKVEGVPQ